MLKFLQSEEYQSISSRDTPLWHIDYLELKIIEGGLGLVDANYYIQNI